MAPEEDHLSLAKRSGEMLQPGWIRVLNAIRRGVVDFLTFEKKFEALTEKYDVQNAQAHEYRKTMELVISGLRHDLVKAREDIARIEGRLAGSDERTMDKIKLEVRNHEVQHHRSKGTH